MELAEAKQLRDFNKIKLSIMKIDNKLQKVPTRKLIELHYDLHGNREMRKELIIKLQSHDIN